MTNFHHLCNASKDSRYTSKGRKIIKFRLTLSLIIASSVQLSCCSSGMSVVCCQIISVVFSRIFFISFLTWKNAENFIIERSGKIMSETIQVIRSASCWWENSVKFKLDFTHWLRLQTCCWWSSPDFTRLIKLNVTFPGREVLRCATYWWCSAETLD